jgi:hypothetical protein
MFRVTCIHFPILGKEKVQSLRTVNLRQQRNISPNILKGRKYNFSFNACKCVVGQNKRQINKRKTSKFTALQTTWENPM